MKFDIHLNVGQIYRTAKTNSLEMFYTGREIAKFCKFFKLTHAVCIYDKWENLKELIDNAPDTKIYGVQWIVDLEDQPLDIGKEGFYGIKLHSHRGYRDSRKYDRTKASRKATEEEWKRKPLSYGLDYADPYLRKVLDRLPKNSLVYMHSQGGASLKNRARPEHIFMLACEYRNLKFIIGHAGCYGGMTSTMPSLKEGIPCNHVTPASYDTFRGPYTNFIDAHISVMDAVMYAMFTHNLWLDTSCYIDQKELLCTTTKWSIGSDYPFGNNQRSKGSNANDETVHFTEEHFKKSGYIWNYDKQVQLFEDIMGPIPVSSTHKYGVEYIEADVEELAKEHHEELKDLKSAIKLKKANNRKNRTK